jgi:hypothetical protein
MLVHVNIAYILTILKICKKGKYAYQEWPHPKDTDYPYSQNVERKRDHGL